MSAARVVFGRPGVVFPHGAYARLVVVDPATVAFESTYDPALVAAFKSQIPFAMRRWDAGRKRWLVDRAYAAHCATLAEQYLGLTIAVPATPSGGTPAHAPIETRLVKLEYLGRCKERELGAEATATGFADGAWSYVFPETVLRAWFEPTGQAEEAPTKKGAPPTLYAVLMVTAKATADELKAAYRRLARSTHPDVNKEPDAAERFIALQSAYETLTDPMKRQRYDVGLEFEQLAKEQIVDPWNSRDWQTDYSPPLRCGYVLVEGRPRVGQFVVSQIQQWEDITDPQGRVMVTSWPKGGQHFVTNWVEA